MILSNLLSWFKQQDSFERSFIILLVICSIVFASCAAVSFTLAGQIFFGFFSLMCAAVLVLVYRSRPDA